MILHRLSLHSLYFFVTYRSILVIYDSLFILLLAYFLNLLSYRILDYMNRARKIQSYFGYLYKMVRKLKEVYIIMKSTLGQLTFINLPTLGCSASLISIFAKVPHKSIDQGLLRYVRLVLGTVCNSRTYYWIFLILPYMTELDLRLKRQE
jgi:hypothetical protein